MKNRGHFTKRIMPTSDHGENIGMDHPNIQDTKPDPVLESIGKIEDDVRLPGSGRRPPMQKRNNPAKQNDAKGQRMSGYYSIDEKLVDEFQNIIGRMNKSEQSYAKRHFSTNVRKAIVASVAPKIHRTNSAVKKVRLTITIPSKVLDDLIQSQDPASLKSPISVFVEATSGYVAEEMSSTISRFNRAYKRD